MKVFLDDVRETPEGWVRCYWPDEVNKLLLTGEVTEVSLDHDLGDDVRGTGYDVITFIEERVREHDFIPPIIRIHSSNSSAVNKMNLGIWAINRYIHRCGKKHPAYKVMEARHLVAQQERARTTIRPVNFQRKIEEFDGVQWNGTEKHLADILTWLNPEFTIERNMWGSIGDAHEVIIVVPHPVPIRKDIWIGKDQDGKIVTKSQDHLDSNYVR